ncbi:MAG: gamma-glutamyl-gamma-aminobutyrate hydrolase family protein [Candidatus Dormibacteria bacterium]
MANRPVIGITVGNASRPGERARYGTDTAYLRSVQEAGGNGVLIPPREPAAAVELLDRLDGLMLTGGADVDPAVYGESRRAECEDPDAPRDRLEISLVRAARRRKMPILGICRGQQVANVALGGTLFQDLLADGATESQHDVRAGGRGTMAHPIEVAGDSWLAEATQARSLQVNSLHHQAVRTVARGLVVTATSADGVVEAMQSRDGRLVTVQSHPEELPEELWARRVFRAFVAMARG